MRMIVPKFKIKIRQKEQSCSNVAEKKIHKGKSIQFVNEVLVGWFFHIDEINQKKTVVPGHISYVNTT